MDTGAPGPDKPKTDRYPLGTKVRHPKSHAKPAAFAEGDGEVAEVIPMNRGHAAYRVKGEDGAVLPVAFEESELKPAKPPKPGPPEPPK